ncbi:MAG: PDZ domain-containing protein [Gemmatimonadales bacterium]
MRNDRLLRGLLTAGLLGSSASVAAQQRRPITPAPARSAAISDIRYQVTFDSTTAQQRTIEVVMSFQVAGTGPVLLSLPAWTPGAYEINNFARWVLGFTAAAGDEPLDWDKLDYDTWRIQPGTARSVSVRFDYLADTLDNAMSWTRPDFAFFNGTNLLFYPEGRGFDFPATLTITTKPEWKVATGMKRAPGANAYSAGDYHELVDMPFFVGRMDYDSMQVSGRWNRLATYPAGSLTGSARQQFWDQIVRMMPPQEAVFQETPWDTYTTMLVFEPSYPGASALEHQNSHLGIYNPGIIGNALLASITAHEIFHAWNVKRLRPADLMPYDYDEPQPTTLLWVSEGITDYYADLALSRGGIIDSSQFMALTSGKAATVSAAPPTALEDASLSTWIQPADGSRYLYYPKGSLAGFLLDILIRDASDNAQSLDVVLRQLYRATFKQGRGFTTADWWRAVTRAAGGRSFTDFNRRYVDGREPFPFDQILPLAGMRMRADTVREPRLGISTVADSSGIVVAAVLPGGPAEAAGLRQGDRLLALGDLPVDDPDFGAAFRARFGNKDGAPLPIRVQRGADTLTLNSKVSLVARVERRIDADPGATGKAVRIRNGIVKGTR